MRKCVAFILVFIYASTVLGGTVHQHFCMGKLIGADVFINLKSEKVKCPQCGMTKKKGCCEDDDRVVKSDKQPDLLQSSVTVPSLESVSITHQYFSFLHLLNISRFKFYSGVHSPPQSQSVPIYIQHCTYLI